MTAVFDIRKRLAKHPMDCLPGCTDCCGPVTMTRREAERIAQRYPHEVNPGEGAFDLTPHDSETLKCAYAGSGCRIYGERPILCRAFGVIDDARMQCPHGRGPRRMISAEAGAKMIRRYVREVGS